MYRYVRTYIYIYIYVMDDLAEELGINGGVLIRKVSGVRKGGFSKGGFSDNNDDVIVTHRLLNPLY